jgi:hypothetical protein
MITSCLSIWKFVASSFFSKKAYWSATATYSCILKRQRLFHLLVIVSITDITLNVLIMLILKNLKLRVLTSYIIGADRKLKRQVKRSNIDPID